MMETHHHLKKLLVPTHILHKELQPNKLECVEHVQKRLGTRLRNIRNEYKSKKPSLSGRENLTDKVINSMQNYFGQAMRSNKGNLYQMKKLLVQYYGTQLLSMMRNTDIALVQLVILVGAAGKETKVT